MKRFHLTLLLVLVAALAVAGCTQQSNPNPILPSGDTNQSDNNAAAPGPNPITDIPSKGGLTVTVTDPDGALIANAVVEVFAGDDAAAQKIGLQNTDASGRTTFETVPVGEVYVTAADHDNLYQGNSADVRINADQTSLVSLQLSLRMPPPSENPNPDAVAVTLESDDAGFYQDGVQVTSIPVPNGAIVQLTINQRTANSVWWRGEPPPEGLLNPTHYVERMVGAKVSLVQTRQPPRPSSPPAARPAGPFRPRSPGPRIRSTDATT
jgi:hypothetical protein